MPKVLFYMKWLFPASLMWFLITATLVPAYEHQAYYFISVSASLFLVLNCFVSWMSGIYISIQISGNMKHKIKNLILAVILNVWSQYFFLRKISQISPAKSLSVIDIFYAFFLFIIFSVSYMMSVGVGNVS